MIPRLPSSCPLRLGPAAAGLLAALCLPSLARAQHAVEAVLINKRVPVGEQAVMVLRVVNGKPDFLPDVIPAEGLSIQRADRVQQSFNIVGGRQQSEFQYFYYIAGTRPGEFRIPPVPVTVGGQQLLTEEQLLTVFEREAGDPSLDASRPYFATLDSSAREIYAGQMSPLDLTVYVRGARSINDVGPPSLRHDSIVFDHARSFAVDAVDLDGITFTTARRASSFFGLTPGAYTLGPAEIQVAMIDDSSPFGRLPGYFQSFVARTLRSNTLEITVKPLPETGRPASFRGAVGDFTIAVKASPLSLSVGDPISLDFEITGPGNYETLEAPVLLPGDASRWRAYDPRKIIDPEQKSDGASSGQATFTQIVMPQEQVSELPAFELSFFNPASGAFESRRTPPVPLQVAPDARAAAPMLAGAEGGAAPAGGFFPLDAVAVPEASFRDIVHIRTTSPSWRPGPLAVTSRPAFWIGQLLPAAGLLALLGFSLASRWKSRVSSSPSSRGISFKKALAAVENAPDRGQHCRAVLAALESWEQEASRRPERHRLTEELAISLVDLRARSQRILYGMSDQEQARPPDPRERAEAKQLLESLRRSA